MANSKDTEEIIKIIFTFRFLVFFIIEVFFLLIIAFSYAYQGTFSEKMELFSKLLQILTPIAAVCIAFWVYKINEKQAEIQEGQAITQMNQSFNQINQMLIQNQSESANELRKIAAEIFSDDSIPIGDLKLSNNIDVTCWMLMMLNMYEAYFINDEEVFDTRFPIILRKLLAYPLACEILLKNSFKKEFVNKCKEKCPDYNWSKNSSSILISIPQSDYEKAKLGGKDLQFEVKNGVLQISPKENARNGCKEAIKNLWKACRLE